MDKLLEVLSKTEVSDDSSGDSLHPRFGDYKKRSEKQDSQNVRRKKRLEELKQRRFDAVSHIRSLTEKKNSIAKDNKSDDEKNSNKMDVDPLKKKYLDKLMQSEWLVDVPDDFKENWLMQVCPIGRRNLVLKSGMEVKVYTKYGKLIKSFTCACTGNDCSVRTSVMDCIFSVADQTYYVLDCMAWNDHYFYDADCDFRFYWKDMKLKENKDLMERSKVNPYPFKPLSVCACNRESITAELGKWDIEKVDGLLFYHRKTAYTLGSTPLVTWLKPDMLDDKLGKVLSEE